MLSGTEQELTIILHRCIHRQTTTHMYSASKTYYWCFMRLEYTMCGILQLPASWAKPDAVNCAKTASMSGRVRCTFCKPTKVSASIKKVIFTPGVLIVTVDVMITR